MTSSQGDALTIEHAPVRTGSPWRRAATVTTRSIAALASVAVLGGMAYGWWAFGDLDSGTVTTDVIDHDVASQRVPLDGAVDMLLVGMDSRTDAYGNPLPREVLDMLNAGVNDGERNTDTMMLVHIPVDGTRAVAISFPRDSWVEIAGDFGKHRLNSAFAYAYNESHEEYGQTLTDPTQVEEQAKIDGRKNLIATIQNLIGNAVTIDRYAEVNLASFYEVTSAIGGVEVCLNQATHDPKSGANFAQGTQTIAGAQALAFVRQRHGLPNGDLDRIVRQQAFLGALADKVLSADMLTSPNKTRNLVAAVQKSVVLSTGWELSTFAAQMQGLTSGGIDFYTIPTLGGANIGGADVIKVDPEQVQQFVAELTTDDSTGSSSSSEAPTTTGTSAPPAGGQPAPGDVTVDVRNGSYTQGLAASVLDRLTGKGFDGGEIGDAEVQDTSVIRYAPGEQTIAEFAANELPGAFTLEEDASLDAGRLSIVLGTDYPAESGESLSGDPLLRLGQPADDEPPAGSTSGATTTGTPTPQVNAGAHTCVN